MYTASLHEWKESTGHGRRIFYVFLNVDNKVDKYSKAIISKYKIKEVEAILPLLNWSKLQDYNYF